jgi:hypothetical protein
MEKLVEHDELTPGACPQFTDAAVGNKLNSRDPGR